jgi:uncharacterized protein YggT (Ycf19 family)
MDIILVPLLLVTKILINFMMGVVIISVLLGWLVVTDILSTNNKIIYYVIDTLARMSNFMLNPIRRRLESISPSFDLSPLILICILMFFDQVIARIIVRFCL